jgi:hypothetical protein
VIESEVKHLQLWELPTEMLELHPKCILAVFFQSQQNLGFWIRMGLPLRLRWERT